MVSCLNNSDATVENCRVTRTGWAARPPNKRRAAISLVQVNKNYD